MRIEAPRVAIVGTAHDSTEPRHQQCHGRRGAIHINGIIGRNPVLVFNDGIYPVRDINPRPAAVRRPCGKHFDVRRFGVDHFIAYCEAHVSVDNAYNYDFTGAGVHAYVIDSGIRTTHQDFGGRASVAADFVGDGQNGQDCFGHGTHVAGTLGGASYGVAKGVSLHSVRVFGCGGSGATSNVVAAVDWVTGHRISPAVVNMSLGGPADATLDAAVRQSIATGVTYVIAAGNDGVDAGNTSPARVTEAITVGATDMSDARAVFTQFSSSNYGSVLDLFAPGQFITSAWWDSDTSQQIISGTSMAAPHVAGVAALYLQSNPGASPATVSDAIVNNATDGRVSNPGPGSPNKLLYSLIPPPSVSNTGQAVPKDYDGDGRADIAIKYDDGRWLIDYASNGFGFFDQTVILQ